MSRRQGKESADTTELEEGQELTPVISSEPPEPPKKTLTLRLLRNRFVQGAFGQKGQEYTFPREEALKRLEQTSGVWEAVNSHS